MTGAIQEADNVFLKLRCFAEGVPWHKNIPTVWMPTTDIQGVVNALADNNFIVGWSLSYDEGSTVINAMQPIGIDNGSGDQPQKLKGHQRQLHARSRAVVNNGTPGLQWAVHTEALAITDPQQHYDHVGLSWADGKSKYVDVVTNNMQYTAKAMGEDWSPTPMVQ